MNENLLDTTKVQTNAMQVRKQINKNTQKIETHEPGVIKKLDGDEIIYADDAKLRLPPSNKSEQILLKLHNYDMLPKTRKLENTMGKSTAINKQKHHIKKPPATMRRNTNSKTVTIFGKQINIQNKTGHAVQQRIQQAKTTWGN